MPDADRVAAYLDSCRDLAACQGDVAALLAAVEDVLKYAAKWDSPTPQPDDTMNVRQDCGVKLRQAISRALLGQEAADAG